MLKIFNTLTGRKEPFEPLTPRQVRMYVCGVTVYDDCHLGHARSAVVFDVIRRYLEHRGFAVTFVKNFTDVDDKIINRANELKIPWQTVTARYIDAYYRDMGRLEVLKATVEPKATAHMDDIIRLVGKLLEKGVAYQVNGDVYFQVEKYPAYGRLSKRKLDEMQAGARVEVDERKRHPMDFALWKGVKAGEPAWPSPWGPGRPGWHIECSAMSIRHLGETFDIHGGGQDLIFPHHENEIAQSCTATGKEFARYWIHNGFVTVDQEKMSKSLGNFFTIKEIFEKFPAPEKVTAEVVRYFLLSTHYRGPIDFSDEALLKAWAGLNNFYDLFKRLEELTGKKGRKDAEAKKEEESLLNVFEQAMDEDFNTPEALGTLQTFRSTVNKLLVDGLSASVGREALATFRKYGKVLGLFQVQVKDWQFIPNAINLMLGVPWPIEMRVAGPTYVIVHDTEIERQIAERNEARRRKDFTRADEIRKALAENGIILEDRPDGTTRWKR
jgi:cysteinyl-tRNA synthetase